jgi:hypothetical protein
MKSGKKLFLNYYLLILTVSISIMYKIKTWFIVVIIMFSFSNCVAWPSLTAFFFPKNKKDSACIFCLALLGNKPATNNPIQPQPVIPPPVVPVSNLEATYIISPLNQTITIGQNQAFNITNSVTNATVTTGVTWTSETTTIATINSSGLANGLAIGTTVIKATIGQTEVTTNLTVIADNIAPFVTSVSSITPTSIRVVFSEGISGGTTIANYKIALSSAVTGTCALNTNFTGTTINLPITAVTQIDSMTYDLTLGTPQSNGILYTLLVNKTTVSDLASPSNPLTCPNNSDFIGNEVLKVSSVACSSTSNILISFSKPVKTGINAANSAECNSNLECSNRYKISGVTDLGDLLSARVLDGVVCGGLAANPSKVCLTTSLLQNGAIYSIITANNTNGDGFDNSGWGAIQASSNNENLQSNPKDRGSFLGCGIPSVNFVDGPIIVDPFTDGSDFGYLTTYANKVYIGPNKTGNAASRFNADGSSPQGISFSFEKDITGAASNMSATTSAGRQSKNTAAAPFFSIGGVGCTANSNTITGCGPDNQDGRGLLVSGFLNGSEYMFISGYTSAAAGNNNDYLYFSTDLDTNLSFKHMDTSRVFDQCPVASPNVTQNLGTDSIEIFNNRIFWSVPGNGPNRPFVVKLNPISPLVSSVDIDCDTSGNESHFLNARWIPGFGNQYNVASNPAPQTVHGPAEPLRASSDQLGGTVQSFNDRLYMMNSGSIRYNGTGSACVNGSSYSAGVCEQTGGFTRSINNSPKTCASDSSCPEWVNITPTDTNYKQFFTIGLPTALISIAPIPAQKPIPRIESFNGNLYAIRNACSTVLLDLFTSSCNYGSICTNDTYCPAGNERPQLWKCNPATTGSATECDAGDWSLVANNGSGYTNFGDANNKQITMLQPNGNYLYIGFDNPLGIKVYRTALNNPISEGDFSQIGGDGFGNPLTNKQIYSTISIQNGTIFFAYSSIGQNSNPVRVHRQQNN